MKHLNILDSMWSHIYDYMDHVVTVIIWGDVRLRVRNVVEGSVWKSDRLLVWCYVFYSGV